MSFKHEDGVLIQNGANSPEGVVTAPVGSIYQRTNGVANATVYVKEGGVGNTGWVAYGAPGGGSAPDVYEDGASVVAAATRLDFKDLNAELISGTLAALYLDLPGLCEGRLTTESGVAVSTADRTAQGTIYWTPYKGNRVFLYDGTRWKGFRFTERSLVLSGLTADKNYDVFLYDNAGTLTLELSAAWTADTLRQDVVSLQNGIEVKSTATTRRYLGTIRSTGIASTEDSAAKRFVWNRYNQMPRTLLVREGTGSWTYTSATVRQANAATGNQVELIVGNPESILDLILVVEGFHNASGISFEVGIGEDSTTGYAATQFPQRLFLDGAAASNLISILKKIVGLGYHKYTWLEANSSGTGTATFYGLTGTIYRSGMSGLIWG